ncbi:MAG TPA: ATP-binding protein [Isosphaeraceae bacterium]
MTMPSPARSRFLRYGGAVVAVAAATAVRWALDPYMGGRQPLTAYYFAVLIVSGLGGLGPSVAAMLLSLAAAVLLVPPGGRFRADSVADVVWIGMFAGVCSAIVSFAEAGRRARARLEREAEQRARIEEALRASRQRLRQLADTMPQIVWTAVPDGSVDYFNARFHEYTGLTVEEALAPEGWREVIHPGDLPRLSALRNEAVGKGEVFEAEVRLRDRAGGYRWHLLRSVPVHEESGQLARRFGTATDVDDLKRAGEALREADLRKDRFLAVLAHELRNPLAPIRNALHLMRHPGGEEPDRAMAERQVVHLARLVDDLMDVSRIATGKIELRKQKIDLGTVVRRAVEAARSAIDARGLSLEVEILGEMVFVEADTTRLEQVLWNLLSNAAKYTDAGGTIRLSAAGDGGDAIVRVADTGIGIEAAMLPRIFEMFVQAGDRAGRSEGGLGLGLSLVKSLVEMHGGRVEASSAGPGEGSTFVVRLPVAPASEGERTSDTRPHHLRQNSRPPRRRVLVVDDNVDAAVSLGRLLTRIYGQDVCVAHDGPSALRSAEEFRPEIVVLDIGMPGMDGYEVARRLRGRPDSSGATLVALTGWGQE